MRYYKKKISKNVYIQIVEKFSFFLTTTKWYRYIMYLQMTNEITDRVPMQNKQL